MTEQTVHIAESMLKEISDVVNNIDDPQSVLDSLARMVTSMLNVGKCSLMLIEPGTDALRIHAAHGLDPVIAKSFTGKVGEGISGWVAQTGRPLLVENIEDHPLFKRRSRSGYSTRSLLSVPLRFRNEVLGVLNVNNKNDSNTFTKADELLLSVVANFVVIALEKARMREVEKQKRQLDAELCVAREIQESILPRKFPSHPHFEVAARNLAARAVAGDFYDIVSLENDSLVVVLGDVCGKGVPAALYMARVMSYFRAVAHVKHTTEEIMVFVNDLLAVEWTERTFVTAAVLLFKRDGSGVSLSSAGHLPVIHFSKATGRARMVQTSTGLPLGVYAGADFSSEEINMEQGDYLVLYTDGVIESRGEDQTMFGDDRLVRAIESCSGSAEELLERTLGAVKEFSGQRPQNDDLTVVVVKRT